MSAMENMIRTVLNAMDIDVETIKTDVLQRVKQFEDSVATLNATLISLHQESKRNAAMLESICAHLSLPLPPPTAPITEITNGTGRPN